MSAQTPFWAWFIPLAAAIIALVGVLLTACVTHSNFKRQVRSAHAMKRAEMRQAWIHKLRDEMANMMSIVQTQKLSPDKSSEAVKSAYKSATLILLLMNKDDPDYQILLNSQIRLISQGMEESTRYIDICQIILKREWGVVKAELEEFD